MSGVGRSGREGAECSISTGARSLGWSDGRNAPSTPTCGRRAEDQRNLAKELVCQPDVILAQTTRRVAALQQGTRTIPIVFVNVADPVGSGFVASLARPGGNLTGPLVRGGIDRQMAADAQGDRAATDARRVRRQSKHPPMITSCDGQAVAPSLGIELRTQSASKTPPTSSAPSSIRAHAERRTDLADGRPPRASRSHHRARRPAPIAGGLYVPLIRRRRRSDVLRHRPTSTSSGRRPPTSTASCAATNPPTCRCRRR